MCYLFPPFSLPSRVLQKIQVEQVEALLANPTLVQSNFELSSTITSDLQTHCNIPDITIRSQSQTPISRKTGSIIWEKYRKLGYSENTRNILLASWRLGTLKIYSKYIDLWNQFASMNSFDIFGNRVKNVLDFLSVIL